MVRRRVPLVLADEWDQRFRQLVYLKDKVPPARVRDFLTAESMLARHLFLRMFVSTELADPALVRRWQRGCGVLADLSLTYAWGSKQLKAKLRALAEDAEILAALQGAAARGTHMSRTLLAVLVIDGSRDSIDALLPSLDPALMTPILASSGCKRCERTRRRRRSSMRSSARSIRRSRNVPRYRQRSRSGR